MERIIVHWTAGSHRAGKLDRQHYHFIFEGDGSEVVGVWPISANARISGSRYAAHTKNCNTGSIGLSMACMAGATERNFGRYPMTEAQFEAMAAKAAELAIEYGIEVTPKTVLSHAEVEKTLGIKQRGKWDFTVLPFRTDLKGARACGNYFRERVRDHMAERQAPPMAFLDPAEGEVDAMLADHDKGFHQSSTQVMASIGGLAGAGGIAADLFGVIENPAVQMVLIVTVAIAVLWIILERRRKASQAREIRMMRGTFDGLAE
ncbi:MAG: N-acetylmuramoyl-L-alanine amidase [Nitratireductor sp.]|nr:N-acetylmuramoyl-L-alanine amidase [Nitratireductor sp.]